MNELARDTERLHRYHDGELGRVERWLFAWRLHRSPALRAELGALENLSQQIAAQFAADEMSAERTPDLWASLEGNLAAIDAQVAAERARGGAATRSESDFGERDAPRLSAWFGGRRLGTAALAAAAAVALFMVLSPASVPGPGAPPVLAKGGGVVRYLDSGGAPVMMIDREDVTIIWMMDAV